MLHFQGVDASSYKSSASSSAAAPPPPPPPGPPPASDSAKSSTPSAAPAGPGAFLAQINKGTAVTSGLKKVDASMQTHKNPELRASSVVSDKGRWSRQLQVDAS